jgi:acyl carrier protein
MKDNSSKKLINEIANILKVNPDRLNLNSGIGSVSEWDSFAHVEIMLYLEERYDLIINEQSIEKLIKIKHIFEELGFHSN